MQDHETSFVVVGMPCVPVQLHRCSIVVGHSAYVLQLGYVRNVATLEACGRRHGYGSTTASSNCTQRVRLRVIAGRSDARAAGPRRPAPGAPKPQPALPKHTSPGGRYRASPWGVCTCHVRVHAQEDPKGLALFFHVFFVVSTSE